MSSLIVEVCKIESVEKHPNADKLDIATIKGWKCVVGKDEWKPGQLAVYIPPDSVLPEEMITKYNLGYINKSKATNQYRLKTIRLRQCISQGLILHIPENKNWKESKDVADYFKITKYEPPEPSFQQFKGNPRTKKKSNPNFDKYTEIENIKNYNKVFEEGELVVVTEKIHGTNARYSWLKRWIGNWFFKLIGKLLGTYEFVYGSHNVQLTWKIPKHMKFYKEDVYKKIAKKLNLEERLKEYKDYIFYGEIFGPGIQDKYSYGLEDINIAFFDIKNITTGKYLDYEIFKLICNKEGLTTVPELFIGKFSWDTLRACTNGESVLCKGLAREGCVVKPIKERIDHRVGRVILKSISEEYLLKDNSDFK